MGGYSITGYDVRSLSTGIAAATDRLAEQLWQVRASEVTTADLDDRVAADYVRVVHGPLADSLTAFRAAAERFASELAATCDHYEQGELDIADTLRVTR